MFRWVRWPCSARRPAPLPRLSRTVGPSIPFSSRLGQRGIAPLCARPLDEPRRQVEVAERAAGLGVHVRHGQRQVRRGEPVEPEPGALGQQLPYLDVVSLAGALLVAAPRVAVEQPRLARPLADEVRDGVLWHGHAIAVRVCDTAPAAGVDTPEDLQRVRALLGI